MKIDKRIFLYLDKQMSIEECKLFEAELSNSLILSNQLEYYKNALKNFEVNEQNFIHENYFDNLIPNFRRNLLTDKKPFKFKTAYALTAVAAILAVAIIIVNPFKQTEDNSLAEIISTVNEGEAARIYDYYSDNLVSLNLDQLNGSSDSLFTELISSELNLQKSDLDHLVSTDVIRMENIYSVLQSDEADLIYDEILKTKYF